MPVAGSAPMSAVAARKARAAAAVAEAEAAAASISSTSSKQSSKSPGASVRLATPTSNAKASTSALPQPRIRKSADTNKKTQEAAKDLSDSDSPSDLESILDDVKAQDGAIRPPARKRPRSVQKGDGKILKDRQTSRPPKLPGSSRYFANGSKQEDPAQKTDMGAKSTVPMEDAESGFLAFSGMTSGKSESEESTEQSEDDGISSDEDSDREKEASSTDLPETRDSRTTSQSAASPAVLSSGRMSSPDQTITSGTVNSIGPTIPYSGFVADIDTNCLIHQMNNKQKDADAYTFGLRSGETLTFVGIGHVEVLKGKLQVGGAVLSSPDSISGVSSANIFAPTYHPLPLLKAIATWSEGSDSTQYPAHFAASTFSTIIRISPLESSIIDLLQVCAVGGTTPPFSAPSNLPLLKFPPLPTLRMLLEPDDASLTGQQQYLLANNIAISVGLSATYIPHSWQIALNKLSESVRLAADDTQEEPVTALIRGPKKVGKSTFSRMILERVLTMGQEMGGKVAFLELDLGQSDFGPPGMVSLHLLDSAATCTIGPGWCQPRIPIRAHFIGDLSPKDEPSSYMEAIVDLIAYFRANIQSAQTRNRVPLVVNTQGWVKGLGADLATRIESLICPTNVYEIVPRGSVDPVPSPVRGQAWLDAEGAILAPGAEIVTLESVNQTGFVPGVFNSKPIEYQASLSMPSVGGGDGGPVPPPYVTDFPPRLTPADLRILNIMTYLYAQDLAVGTSDVKWDFSRPLVNMRPLIVDVETGLAAGVRVLPLGSSIPDGHKLGALNASIVAIVACDNALQTTEIVNTDQMTRAKFVWQKSFRCGALNLMPNSSTRCLGLGIVRSIDVLRGEFHLLTPLSAEFLSTCGPLGLVKGVLELPIWASLDFDALKDVKDSKLDVAPLTYPTAANGAQATLAGVARNRVPYIEWPWIPPISRTLSYSQGATRPTRHATSKNAKKNARQQQSTLATLGSQKRKVRRNLMRKGQFA